ncbi:DEAD/DEAH box helicase [Litchfieldia alkalitelluris]|uniref:DEAD/DEAH box helicase n=1 Tax=Litchfieldia alkalitelluris TaxID=304268 RepID=UPI0009979F51|nr:DEAD/DEAH box helicase [Litchfieldia alkalitelluris]
MDFKLNHKTIKEMCGSVSFKRGEAFYRADKVIIRNYHPEVCEATVKGVEDFHVTVTRDSLAEMNTQCSCPKLGSYQKDCQHIAAVLLAIHDMESQPPPIMDAKDQSDFGALHQHELTEGLLTIFDQLPQKASRHQLHFENREILEVVFTCIPVTVGENQTMFGIKMKVDYIDVSNIRRFLIDVSLGKSCNLSRSTKYEPSKHCFHHDDDVVILALIQVIQDEESYINLAKIDHQLPEHILLIPPTSWERVLPLLIKAPSVPFEYEGVKKRRLSLVKGGLPLQFSFRESNDKEYKLQVQGLGEITLMDSYQVGLKEGNIIKFNDEQYRHLSSLKTMLDTSETNEIPIQAETMPYFIGKIVPGLKKLGNVQFSEGVSQQFLKSNLTAKLFLDRLKNRLLVGLEFHYEKIIINPLDDDAYHGPVVIRDKEKEAMILELMEESSFVKTDGGYFVHNEELEYEFLQYIVPKLQKLVQIYATTAVRNRLFRATTPPKIRVKVLKERTNWLEFKFEMDGISNTEIKDLLSALEEKRKYYRLRNGSLLSLETKEFEEIQRFLKAGPIQDEDLESGLNVPVVKGMQLMDSHSGEDIFSLEESFKQFISSITSPEQTNFQIPKQIEPILRDYQKQGFQWMKTLASYQFGGILADEMGLGKTVQSITFILSSLEEMRKKNKPTLIVCPSSLKYNWLSELMKFAPEIEAIVVDGDLKERKKLQQEMMAIDVMITSYPLLRKDIKWFEEQHFHTVFFDEAQMFKNPYTQTFRAVKRVKADFRFGLTGTPIENSIEELWAIFHVVFPELLLGLKEFSHLSRERISKRIRPFLLRRLKEDVLMELNEKKESVETVDLLPEQKKLYTAYLAKLRHDTLKHLDKDTVRKNRIKILAGLTRLRQICCHPALFVDGYEGKSAKFEQLMQLLKEAKLSGRRVLIFSQFTKMLNLIGRELAQQGTAFFYLDGQTASEERVELCNRFNEGEKDVFLISLKAGGTGLNLTGADTVILYDNWWNPAVEDQAASRAHRMGQKNIVRVIKLVASGTIEEKMNELQDKKKQLIEEIIDENTQGSTTLTEEDLRELLIH